MLFAPSQRVIYPPLSLTGSLSLRSGCLASDLVRQRLGVLFLCPLCNTNIAVGKLAQQNVKCPIGSGRKFIQSRGGATVRYAACEYNVVSRRKHFSQFALSLCLFSGLFRKIHVSIAGRCLLLLNCDCELLPF